MSLDEMRKHSGLTQDKQNTINVFVEFITIDERIASLYEEDKFILRIEFDSLNDGRTGRVFKNRKVDYAFEDFISIDLDNNFYDYYLLHTYNPLLKNYDLRIMYYLNRNDTYFLKMLRPTYYEFSKFPFCDYYEYTDPRRLHIKTGCINQGIFKTHGKNWCPIHFN